VVAGVLAFLRPRAGLAVALAVPVLPLGNVALGLAILYAGAAALWLALHAREPHYGLLPAAAPLLALVGALALAPLLVQPLRSPLRRAAAAAAAVFVAAVVAGIRGDPLPLTGEIAPELQGIVAAENPLAPARELLAAAVGQPGLVLVAAALALAAALLPASLALGGYGVAALGSALVAAALLPAPEVDALPVLAAVWLMCAALWAWSVREPGGVPRTPR
jgi:hypothetical protein